MSTKKRTAAQNAAAMQSMRKPEVIPRNQVGSKISSPMPKLGQSVSSEKTGNIRISRAGSPKK